MTTRKKPMKQATKKDVVLPPDTTNSETHRLIYSNSVQIEQSPYDIKLTFGLVQGIKGGKVQILNLDTIILSPQHAKQLVKVLGNNIAKYEADYMKLDLKDDEMVAEFDESELEQ